MYIYIYIYIFRSRGGGRPSSGAARKVLLGTFEESGGVSRNEWYMWFRMVPRAPTLKACKNTYEFNVVPVDPKINRYIYIYIHTYALSHSNCHMTLLISRIKRPQGRWPSNRSREQCLNKNFIRNRRQKFWQPKSNLEQDSRQLRPRGQPGSRLPGPVCLNMWW